MGSRVLALVLVLAMDDVRLGDGGEDADVAGVTGKRGSGTSSHGPGANQLMR